MGADIEISEGYIKSKVNGRLKAIDYNFPLVTVGATISAIYAATLADGKSHFQNCAMEPEIEDLCNFLVKMGAKISGIGTKDLVIEGVKQLGGAEHQIIFDRIEAGTYLIAAAMTGGELNVYNVQYENLADLCQKLELTGQFVKKIPGGIHIKATKKINPVSVITAPYPGFVTDLQAQFMALMTLSTGIATIEERIFENRFMHVPELCRMGADITISHNKATITGVSALKGAEVMASDLRASVSLIIAGLVANGITQVNRIYHLDRGYENLVEKLSSVGAKIKRISKN